MQAGHWRSLQLAVMAMAARLSLNASRRASRDMVLMQAKHCRSPLATKAIGAIVASRLAWLRTSLGTGTFRRVRAAAVGRLLVRAAGGSRGHVGGGVGTTTVLIVRRRLEVR